MFQKLQTKILWKVCPKYPRNQIISVSFVNMVNNLKLLSNLKMDGFDIRVILIFSFKLFTYTVRFGILQYSSFDSGSGIMNVPLFPIGGPPSINGGIPIIIGGGIPIIGLGIGWGFILKKKELKNQPI